MTDNEIMKALECCAIDQNCNGCPHYANGRPTKECLEITRKNALDLINRQKAEIERLQTENRILSQKRVNLFERLEIVNDAREKAIKQFADRLKKSSCYSVVADGDREIPSTRRYSISESDIDKIVKEMVGEG